MVLLAVAAVVGYLSFKSRNHTEDPPVPVPDDRAIFHERGREAGIDFHMTFLADEQGEKFKVNLYDHGCGVAVADLRRRRP